VPHTVRRLHGETLASGICLDGLFALRDRTHFTKVTTIMTRRFVPFALMAAALAWAVSADAKLNVLAKDPYLGAVVMDAESGDILFADGADTKGYPASVLKLMDLLVILEQVDAGRLRLDDPVRVTADASRIGGSQVYLKEGEVFTVEELLYALMIQSANDAATALAIHVAGSKDGFVALLNEKARAVGMTSSVFHSVHGLPPGPGQEPDVTTARDLALMGRELLKHPDALRFTSTTERSFRADSAQPFIMRNHNNLLGRVEGCDGFKTGFFSAAGFSVAATAKRKDRRLICVVLGSASKQVRDAKAAELIAKGFLILPSNAASTAIPAPATRAQAIELPGEEDVAEEEAPTDGGFWKPYGLGVVTVLGLMGIFRGVARWRHRNDGDFVRR
jgi:D-alanyl-D-alanine carboxypeptidase (penicillin-binding protein 5/6)